MKRLLHLLLLIAGLFHLTGGPLGMLQCVAWARMLVAYSMEKGLIEGVKASLNGAHPCSLCDAIESARTGATHEPAPARIPGGMIESGRFDLSLIEAIKIPSVPWRDAASTLFPAPAQPAGLARHEPDVPPPRIGA